MSADNNKRKAGRPKKLGQKRIQLVIPEEILEKLDAEVKKLPKGEQNRSKLITNYLKKSLNSSNQKKFNVYSQIFQRVTDIDRKGILPIEDDLQSDKVKVTRIETGFYPCHF